MSLQIYRASAGSGKTFRLSLNFIKLVVFSPESYKNILAVTFTNAATAEMKTRVISDLYNLYKFPDSKKSASLLKVLLEEMNETGTEERPNPFRRKDGLWTKESLSKAAGEALQQILHGYSLFHIETIDSFFQTVLRNMVHELGLGAALGIELDNSVQVEVAVQSLYDDVKTHGTLKDAIVNFSIVRNEEGKTADIDSDLKKMGDQILKERFQSSVDMGKYADIFDLINQYHKEIKKIKLGIENALAEVGNRFLNFAGDKDDFKNCFNERPDSVYNYFIKLANKTPEFSLNKTLTKWKNRDNKIVQKGDLSLDTAFELVEEAVSLVEAIKTDYHTATLILGQIQEIAFIYDIYINIKKANSIEGKFLLSDTPILLNKLINPKTAPFIYEKIGGRLDHIMIDEFQDTSATQWANFKPLLIESLSREAENRMEGGQLLIVGDPKQSIYRWRNGDWRLIEDIGNRDGLSSFLERKDMDTNFRSSKKVVDFNNELYTRIAEGIDNVCDFNANPDKEFTRYKDAIKEIYKKAAQKCSKSEDYGYVSVAQLGEKKIPFKELALERLVKDIIECQIKGVDFNNIAILLRKNEQMEIVAAYLAAYRTTSEFMKIKEEHPQVELKVISSEAFKLSSSVAIRVIIDAIRYIIAPEDDKGAKTILALDFLAEVKKAELDNILANDEVAESEEFKVICDKLKSLTFMPLYELVETIYFLLKLNEIPGQDAYLYTFLDIVLNYTKNFGSDLNLFLNRWEEKISGEKVPFSKGEGIKMFTIHKSKGLEFDTVFVPFCDWNIEPTWLMADTLWCRSSDIDRETDCQHLDTYTQVSPLPIKYGSSMGDSVFSKAYYMEKLMKWIDNINMLYVATTRAENNLFIYCDKKEDKKKEGDEKKTLGKISEYITDIIDFGENDCYSVGEVYVKPQKKEEDKDANRMSLPMDTIKSEYCCYVQRKEQFRQSYEANVFVEGSNKEEDAETKNLTPVDYGKLLHLIFSKIATAEDVDKAIEEAIMEGVDIDKDELRQMILEKIENPEFKEWFAPNLKLMNERTIAYYDEEGKFTTKRPDRVIVDGKNATIIDYKSGRENPKYTKQLLMYASLLKDMGYENVSAYIWYLNTDKKIKVA